MSKETVGTIGDQKENNYALRADMTKEEFIKEVTDGLLPPPAYFPLNVKLNKEGYQNFEEVLKKGANPLSPNAFEAAANETGAVVLDVRHQSDFATGNIPRSIFIGIDGGFAPWVGALIADISQPILLIAPEGRLEETITRLSRVGFDNVIGYLEGGFEAWKNDGKEIDTVETISAEDFAKLQQSESIQVMDVRKESEYLSEHVIDAENAPLDDINNHLATFTSNDKNYVHCAGGYRSMIANSILKSRGIHNVVDVLGGFGAIKDTDVAVSAYVYPSTL